MKASVRMPLTASEARAARIQYWRWRSRSPHRWKNARSPATRASTVPPLLPLCFSRVLNIAGQDRAEAQEARRRGQRIRQLRRDLDDQPGVDDGAAQDRQRQSEA